MAKDNLAARIDRLIELRERLRGEEDFTDHRVQDLYAEYRKLLAQVVATVKPIMQRWVDAGIVQVACPDGEDSPIVREATSVYINGCLTLTCTPLEGARP